MSTSEIDLRTMPGGTARIVRLVDGNPYPALWIDDLAGTDLDRIEADESLRGAELIKALRRHVGMMMPTLPADALAALTWRQVKQLNSTLKEYEPAATETASAVPPVAPNPES